MIEVSYFELLLIAGGSALISGVTGWVAGWLSCAIRMSEPTLFKPAKKKD